MRDLSKAMFRHRQMIIVGATIVHCNQYIFERCIGLNTVQNTSSIFGIWVFTY